VKLAERWVEIPVEAGSMAGFLAAPADKPAPGVVMLQEIFGVNPAMQEKARLFANLGYCVLVPDLFWRLEPRVSLGYGEEDRKRGFGLMQSFDFAAGIKDIAAAASWLKSSGFAKDDGLGVIGFCLGGKLAVASTAAYRFAAVAALYGVRLDADPARLKAIDVPLQVHVGDRDAHIPAESIAKIKDVFADRPNARLYVYPGAQHGFFNAARSDVYSPEAAKLAQERIGSMLKAAL
jgi:carboxymethylenebutenolidase